MKTKSFLSLLLACASTLLWADEITTVDGHKYDDVRDVAIKYNGLFFVTGAGDTLKGVTVPFNNLPKDIQEKYHCDPYELGLSFARQNKVVNLNKSMAFSLDDLEAAKKKAMTENKPLGFIMEWDMMFVPGRPMSKGGNGALAHFYSAFNQSLVLVFVSHERELDKVPDAVKKGFFGHDEGGFAPNMAVVTPDCSQYICEIPLGGKGSDGQIREQIFRQKIEVIKKFVASQSGSK